MRTVLELDGRILLARTFEGVDRETVTKVVPQADEDDIDRLESAKRLTLAQHAAVELGAVEAHAAGQILLLVRLHLHLEGRLVALEEDVEPHPTMNDASALGLNLDGLHMSHLYPQNLFDHLLTEIGVVLHHLGEHISVGNRVSLAHELFLPLAFSLGDSIGLKGDGCSLIREYLYSLQYLYKMFYLLYM